MAWFVKYLPYKYKDICATLRIRTQVKKGRYMGLTVYTFVVPELGQ